MSPDLRLGKWKELWRRKLAESRQVLGTLAKQIVEKAPKNKAELAQLVRQSQSIFQKKNFGLYGKALTVVGSAFFISDLTALVAEKWIPEPPPLTSAFQSSLGAASGSSGVQSRRLEIDKYNVIFARNLFNSQGLIPDEEGLILGDGSGAASRTQMPLALIGTLVLRDEIRSLATIEDKGDAGKVYPVRMTDEIPNKIRITKIEPYKVTFLNLSNRRLEFIDLPQDAAASVPRTSGGGGTKVGVEQLSNTRFVVSRREIDSALVNLNKILTEARAVPNFENGVAKGYKLFQIAPGSIYEKLGIQNGDVIHGVNGEPMVDPGKAFTMLSELKTTNHLELTINRNGKDQVMVYDIQ